LGVAGLSLDNEPCQIAASVAGRLLHALSRANPSPFSCASLLDSGKQILNDLLSSKLALISNIHSVDGVSEKTSMM
jgi:hypothetical protein